MKKVFHINAYFFKQLYLYFLTYKCSITLVEYLNLRTVILPLDNPEDCDAVLTSQLELSARFLLCLTFLTMGPGGCFDEKFKPQQLTINYSIKKEKV